MVIIPHLFSVEALNTMTTVYMSETNTSLNKVDIASNDVFATEIDEKKA